MLPDYLAPSLRLVLVGTAAGEKSAERGHYYAGPGNDFWSFLHQAGLTPIELTPADDASLLSHGIGLTDLVKSLAQSHDRGLPYDIPMFTKKIEMYQPAMVAFTSKAAGTAFTRRGSASRASRRPLPQFAARGLRTGRTAWSRMPCQRATAALATLPAPPTRQTFVYLAAHHDDAGCSIERDRGRGTPCR